MKPNLVPAGINQFEDRFRRQGAAAKKDVGSSLHLVQHL